MLKVMKAKTKTNQEYSSVKAIWLFEEEIKTFLIEKQKLRVLKYYSGFRQKSSRHFSKEKKKQLQI